MLEKENIPHDFTNLFDGWHIEYSVASNNGYRICSVIEHKYSYGSEKDLLEIMGLVSKEEAEDGVLGYLTAEEVFKRIYEHYNPCENG